MNSTESSRRNTRRRRRKPPLQLRLMRLAFSKLGLLFPSLLGRWAYRIWFSTQRFNAPKREQLWLEGARQVRIELAGFPVMTYQWGEESAPMVVLVHGWNGRGGQMGAFAEPLVEAGYRVLSYDAPAHGQTPGNSSNIFKMRNVLKAIADEVAPIHGIIAHSFGGMVSALALSEGLAANRVVVLSSPARFELLVERFADVLHMPQAVRSNLATRIKNRFGEQKLAQISPVVTSQQLAHIPALIIHDEQDHDVPASQAELIQQSWPNSQLLKTDGLGHKRILYNQQVLEKVTGFITG